MEIDHVGEPVRDPLERERDPVAAARRRTSTGTARARGRGGRTRSARPCAGAGRARRAAGSRAGCTRARRRSALAAEPAREPADPPHRLAVLAHVAEQAAVAGASGKRWISMPSISSNGASWRPAPWAQTTTTSQPASCSVRASFQTRRSDGTGRVLADEQDAAGHRRRRARAARPGTVREQDLHVEPERAAAHVLEVERDHLLERQLRAAADLPQAGDARLDGEAREPVLGVALDLVLDRRARADQRHVAAQHVPQLRQLVEARAAQEPRRRA